MTEPIGTIGVMDKKPKQKNFYIDEELIELVDDALKDQGCNRTEGVTRLLKFYLRMPKVLRPLLLNQIPDLDPREVAMLILQKIIDENADIGLRIPPPDNAGGSPADPKSPVFPKPDDAIYNIRRTAAKKRPKDE